MKIRPLRAHFAPKPGFGAQLAHGVVYDQSLYGIRPTPWVDFHPWYLIRNLIFDHFRYLSGSIVLSHLTLQFGQTKVKLITRRLQISRLEKDLLEVNGLKNELNAGRDNFKAMETSLKIIQTSANQTMTLIETCEETIEDCETILVIRSKIETLKSEGKTVWNYFLQTQ